jgi:hypothetical protein
MTEDALRRPWVGQYRMCGALYETARTLLLNANVFNLPRRWRHHGLGMLQAEFTDTLRVHVWHPNLVSSKMAWPRCVHDHRFDITSVVLAGRILDIPHVVGLIDAAPFTWGVQARCYEIEHAKNQDRLVLDKHTTATSARFLGDVQVKRLEAVLHGAGETYEIERRAFHTTEVHELAVTVVHRSRFDSGLARVLCAADDDVTATSGIVRDESVEAIAFRQSILREAHEALSKARNASEP